MPFIIGDQVTYKVGEKPGYGNPIVDVNPPKTVNASTGTTVDQSKVPTTSTTAKSSSSGSSGGGGGGGGGGSSSGSMSQAEVFYDWNGRYPTASEKATMASGGWTEDTIRRNAVKSGGNGPAMQMARNRVRQIGAGFYGGDPTVIPGSLVNTLISDGTYADETYLRDTYFPMLKGGSATNPNSAKFIDVWTDATGRSLTYTASQKLDSIIKTYGYTPEAEAAWTAWVKTTDSAISGNYGAEHRIAIGDDVNKYLGRPATEAELAPNSTFWNLSDAARLESIRATPEYQAIYSGKPAWMSEGDWVGAAKGYDSTFSWYYGDSVTVNPDGSLTIPHGNYYQAPTAGPVSTTPTPTAPATPTAPPAWKSLSTGQFATDLGKVGITVTNGKYFKDGTEISADSLLTYLPENTYYKDAQGFHYVQEFGAVDKNGVPATNTRPAPAAADNTTTQRGGLNNFAVSYVNNDMVADLVNGNISPEQLRQQFVWQEEAAYDQGVYGSVLEEAYGSSAGVDWYKLASGAQGSGAMRAQIMEAQNRVSYREAYRQVFGNDPDPSDYDRITQEYVSPGELIRETQAKNSADEMYPEVSDLMQRVYGEAITVDELKDMALGREGSGELKAMINQATKLENYRWLHKQYYNAEPTPTDYAKYAGYASPAELQWEILTDEKIKEFTPDIQEAFTKAYGYQLTDEQLKSMLGEQRGYGELNQLYTKAKETVTDQEKARDWAFQADQANVNYGAADQGGFKTTAPGLASL